MFALTVLLRDRLLARTTFAQEKVGIGRTPENEVHLDNLAVSRRHASIELVGGVHVLREFGSGNGTFVNGERVVGRRALNDGDRISIGKFVILFRGDRQRSENIDLDDSSSYDFAGKTIVTGGARHAKERRCPFVAYLELARGSEPPVIHRLERDVCLAGTAQDCDVVLEQGVCAPHAALLIRGWQGFTIYPLGPGTRRNGVPLTGRATLAAKDELRFGSRACRFMLSESEAMP
ncbi:MAG TPA: FHA domain-containing protein [Planctomycetota bacterium]|nr:FHA domain-containing protein [Planctomycetota bacterium]